MCANMRFGGGRLDREQFKASLEGAVPPRVGSVIEALWHDRKGDWDRAHRLVQDLDTAEAAWVHAYLHRREGDLDNALYWYRRARRPASTSTLEAEWDSLVDALLTAERE